MVGVALLRQLIRAEQARQQCYSEGRLPEFLDAPPPYFKLHLEAAVQLRAGAKAEAAALLAQAEAQWPAVEGVCDGRSFDVFRDLDDLTAPFLDVLTSTGKHYWAPLERIECLEFHAPERPHDLLWRRAHMVVHGGPDGEVFLPALYPGSHAAADDSLRLGRSTEWLGGEGEPVRGLGQRTFLVGADARPIMELGEITVNIPAGAAHDPRAR